MNTWDLQSAIRAASAKYGVDPGLALAVASQESALNPSAVSSAGAIGVFQLMPVTAAGLGVDPHDPAQNIDGGVRYLSQLLQRYGGDVKSALWAYNWGMGNVDAFLQTGLGAHGQPMPAETVNYAPSVLARFDSGIGGSSDPFSPSDPTDTGSDLTAANIGLNLSPTVIEAAAVVGAIALGWLLLPSRS